MTLVRIAFAPKSYISKLLPGKQALSGTSTEKG